MRNPIEHLYIHVPFCPSKCSYCAFETHIGSLKLVPAYLDALENELARVHVRHLSGNMRTVYFGGGTPSMLDPADVARLLATVDALFGISSGAEITLESHPATVDGDRLRGFRDAGITRISFGGESLNAGELSVIGRLHSPGRVVESVETCRWVGIPAVALDLMYGLPSQTPSSWETTLHAAVDAGSDHLSLYPLSIEPRTVFARRMREGMLDLPSDETVVEMYRRACALLRGEGFEHYEVANWARPGRRCLHSLAYWHNQQFFGVGVGAHAYMHPWRTENLSGTQRYIRCLRSGTSPVTHAEPIEAETEVTESIMLRLRLLSDGLDMDVLESQFNLDVRDVYARDLADLHRLGLVEVTGSTLRLSESAVPVANEIWQRFMRPPREP